MRKSFDITVLKSMKTISLGQEVIKAESKVN